MNLGNQCRLPGLVEVDEDKTSFENPVVVVSRQLHNTFTLNNNKSRHLSL